MKVDNNEIKHLLNMQKIDMDFLRLSKKLEELPQREKILTLREKNEGVSKKANQVQTLLKEHEHNLQRINDEDERLQSKEDEAQKKIEEAQGDYRAVASLTKELEGVAKRRATLQQQRGEIEEKSSEVLQIKEQIDQALSTLKEQENVTIESFQKEGGALKNELARLETLRKKLCSEVAPDIVTEYEKRRSRLGGIALSALEGGACSVCRSGFDEGKLLQIKADAPLSECPSCKRMMVVIND